MVIIQANEKNALQRSFERILCNEDFGNCTNEVVEIIAVSGFNQRELGELFKEYRKNFETHKDASLELVLAYIRVVLEDSDISEEEILNVCLLKRFLKINEGDFIEYKSDQVAEILNRQLNVLYTNNRMEPSQCEFKFQLQDLFDLSYDEFLDLEKESIELALARGANISDLDTYYPFPQFSCSVIDTPARLITQEVKDQVWKRDGGKCTKCASEVRLEFDHIIPFSKGGASTYRNVQLLCERCNRKKSGKIGLD